MNYQETIQWMFAQLPMYQQQGASAYKKDLTNTILLAKHLGNPEKKLKCIHVAGTNGKGSTSHLLASVFQEAGYKVGLYTSPHLKSYRERIKINGKEIDEDFVVEFINTNKSFFEENQLSFFEMTVGLAFDYFSKSNTDINIIEVGMGGRLDSTNIITPIVSVITNIAFDHVQFLGNTLDKIAVEKAGIIKQNVPVVIGEYTNETKSVFLNKATATNSKIFFAQDSKLENFPSSLQGDYQYQNKKTVLKTLEVLNSLGYYKIPYNIIKKAFLNVLSNTGFQGRWHKIGDNPKIICDTAHNSHGLKIVLKQLSKEKFKNLRIILGMVNDKDLDEILPLFPRNAVYYFCRPNIPRGLDEKKMKETANKYFLTGEYYSSVIEAFNLAKNQSLPEDLIFIGGSTFVVAEIL